MVAVTLADVLLHPTAGWAVLILRETSGPRALVILINGSEAYDAATAAADHPWDRPRPYEFVGRVLAALNADIEYAVVHDVVTVITPGYGSTEAFVASFVVRGPDGLRQIDARPSDALPATLHRKRPIYVAEKLLEQANLTFPTEFEVQLGVGIQQLVRVIKRGPEPANSHDEEATRVEDAQDRAVGKMLEHLFPNQAPVARDPATRIRSWWAQRRGR